MVLCSRNLKFVTVMVFAILLSQCTKISNTPMQTSQPLAGPLASPYTMPATAYLALAKKQPDTEKQALLIMAAGRLIYDGQWQEGRAILAQTSNLPIELASEKSILLAKVDLIREQPRAAIAKLSNVQAISDLPVYYQAQFHEMLAYAYHAIGNDTQSVSERLKLEKLLPDEASKANNRRVLWLTLTTLPIAELNTLALEATEGSLQKGWLQLALISRKHYDNPQDMLGALQQWQAQFPQHSGNYVLPSPLASVTERLFSAPRKMALLLPLTGPLAGPGGAVKDGFMAAYELSNAGSSVTIRTYNTDATNVATLYQQALADGADYVVGPLSKSEVAAVAGLNHPVPTLVLNDVEVKVDSNLYPFGLSPSLEARQVAVKARRNGYTRALVIAPAGVWGDEVVAAFSKQWRTNGGAVVDTLHYQPNDDMNKIVRDFLHISDSEVREKRLKQMLGHNIESTPRRRQDFDMIFLLAYPSKARQIMPMLKYYYAGDVPVYSTSAVYSGSTNIMKDRDLDGILFCDMPWVFNHQAGSKNWPEQYNSYNRLYALGMDSYALATQLNQLILFPAVGINDKSGILYINASQQISRILIWGQFKQGFAQKIDEGHNL